MRLIGNRCRCAACGEGFNSVSVFDRHRVGTWGNGSAARQCLTPAAMAERGWSRNPAGFWIMETRAQRAARAVASRAGAAIGAEAGRSGGSGFGGSFAVGAAP